MQVAFARRLGTHRLASGMVAFFATIGVVSTAKEPTPNPVQATETVVEVLGGEDAASENKKSETEFVRLSKSEKGEPLALETAIVRYVRGEGKDREVVDLIGAVHIGEKSYYDRLNESFAGYETLLYELVADADRNVPQQRENSGPSLSVIGGSQQAFQNALGLEFQLERIDYTKKNFVHADMSPEQFDKSMTERGESWAQIYFRSLGYGAAQGDKNELMGFSMLGALFADDPQLRMKRLMAEQLGDMKTAAGALGGKEGSTILTERNRVALEKLDEILKDSSGSVGVFYGAAHLPDMEERLLARGFAKGETTWLEAWNLRPAKKAAKPSPGEDEPARTPAENDAKEKE